MEGRNLLHAGTVGPHCPTVHCVICNDRPGTETSLRIRGRNGDRREADMRLCDDCSSELLALEWIEADPRAASD